MRSVLLDFITRSCASVVPIKLSVGLVPLLPFNCHANEFKEPNAPVPKSTSLLLPLKLVIDMSPVLFVLSIAPEAPEA